MRRALALLAVCAACGSVSSSPGGGADAGAESSPGQDAADDACFPFCSSSSGGSGSSSGADADVDAQSCDGLRAKVESLLPAARACNPALGGQCTGTTDGICCPVTVSAGNESAVNDLAVAVASYKQSCTPSCIGIVCPAAPSGVCQPPGTGSQGLCQ